MRSSRDVEAYLLRMGRRFSEASEGTFLVQIEKHTVAIQIEPSLVLARVVVGSVPLKHREALFEHLLRLNASGLVHASYGIEDGQIVLSAALELENLDYNELDAVLAEMDLGLAQQLPQIRTWIE